MKPTLTARIWAKRPLILYAFVFCVVAAMLATLWIDRKVAAYEAATPRDPVTGVMIGAEARSLGPRDAEAAILLVHGFIGTPNNYHDLPDTLAAMGWRVEAMLLPGHGTSPRDFERVQAEDMVEAVRKELLALQAQHDLVVLVGHSMGAAIATIVASETSPDALILAAPYFGITKTRLSRKGLERFTRFTGTFLRWLPSSGSEPPVFREESWKDIVSYHWFPLQGAVQALRLEQWAAKPETLAAIHCPVYLIHSHHDTVTCPIAAQAALDGIAADRKEALWLEQSDHVIFWDYDDALIKEGVGAFLQSLWAGPEAEPSIS